MEAIVFPWADIKKIIDPELAEWVERLQGALQIPLATVVFMLISATAFELHRTIAQYSPMLGIPALPWPGTVGRPGEGKSIAVWFLKQVMIELSKRKGVEAGAEEDEVEAEMEPADGQQPKAPKRAKTQGKRFTADMGTLYGFFGQMEKNEGRCLVALHEAKPLLGKILAELPGNDPQALNKAYDRDEVSNTVLTAGSRFHMDSPWLVFFLAVHLDDLKLLFGDVTKDTCAIFSRFDFFAQAGMIPELDDFNDYDQDEAMEFVCDVLELVEIQYPDISKDDTGVAVEEKGFFSKRTQLWRIPQKNNFFRHSFNGHAQAQKKAKAAGDHRVASHQSKIKTKQCRYSVPFDAIIKGFRQKHALEKYREEQLALPENTGNEGIKNALRTMNILALRQRAIDKHPDEAKAMDLPFWPRAVFEESAEVGHLLANFLAEQSRVLVKFLHPAAQHAPTALIPSSVYQTSAATAKDSTKLTESDIDALDMHRVHKCVQALLNQQQRATKITTIKKAAESGPVFDAAVRCLEDGGFIISTTWKKIGATGYASSYIIKNGKYDLPGTSIAAANLVRDWFGLKLTAIMTGQPCEVSRSIEDASPHLFPVMTAAMLEKFKEIWEKRLQPLQELAPQTDTNGAPLALAKAGAQTRSVDSDAVNKIREHFRWIIFRTSNTDIRKAYLQQKLKGFDPAGHDWDVLLNTFCALGLAVDTTRGGSAGTFTLRRPQSDEALEQVVVGLTQWLGEPSIPDERKNVQRFQDTQANPGFSVNTFRAVLADFARVAATQDID